MYIGTTNGQIVISPQREQCKTAHHDCCLSLNSTCDMGINKRYRHGTLPFYLNRQRQRDPRQGPIGVEPLLCGPYDSSPTGDRTSLILIYTRDLVYTLSHTTRDVDVIICIYRPISIYTSVGYFGVWIEDRRTGGGGDTQ